MFIYELSGCGFESCCCHLNFRYRACFEQRVPWHSGNYRLWIHSEKRLWHDNNIHLRQILIPFERRGCIYSTLIYISTADKNFTNITLYRFYLSFVLTNGVAITAVWSWSLRSSSSKPRIHFKFLQAFANQPIDFFFRFVVFLVSLYCISNHWVYKKIRFMTAYCTAQNKKEKQFEDLVKNLINLINWLVFIWWEHWSDTEARMITLDQVNLEL